MVDNDIYGSKELYHKIIQEIELFTQPESKKKKHGRRREYYVKNPANLIYFKQLFKIFEMKDISYIHRLRLVRKLLLTTYATEKDLKDCCREDINSVVAFMHNTHSSPKSKRDFIVDLKYLWKMILPHKDEHGEPSDTILPYVVRHLSTKIEKSKEKRRTDKLTLDEFERIVQYFSNDIRIQAFLTLSFESLGRPQELLYLKIRDVEMYDNYARIWISEHGKEGTGFLRCIDSFPYVSKWYNSHPLRSYPEAFLFINLGSTNKHEQLKPRNVNKKIKEACEALNITKPITCYSLKRNGVTYRRLRGDSDVEIQHVARWTSTKQLKIYDLSHQDDTFKLELIRRGLIPPDEKYKYIVPDKKCGFCDHLNGIADATCRNCLRPLDRKEILKREQIQENTIQQLQDQIQKMQELWNTFSPDKNLVELQAKKYLKQNMPSIIKELVKQDPKLIKQALCEKTIK